MDRIALALWPTIGWPLSFVIAGITFDLLTTEEAKSRFVTAIFKSSRLSDLGGVLQLFLDEVLSRVLGRNIFSRKFLFRSAVISLLAFFAIAILQSIMRADRSPTATLYNSYLAATILGWLALFTANVFTDFVSNALTVSFVRMAASSGRLLDFIVSVAADLSLTIAAFTLIFPVGLVAFSALEANHRDYVAIQITQPAESPSNLLAGQIPVLGTRYQIGVFSVGPPISSSGTYGPNKSLIAMSKSGSDPAKIMPLIIDAFQDGQASSRFVFPDQAVFEVNTPKLSLNLSSLSALYEGAFLETNNLRNYLLSILHLRPVSNSVSELLFASSIFRSDGNEVIFRCQKTSNFRSKISSTGTNTFAQALASCNNDVDFAMTFDGRGTIRSGLQNAAFGNPTIPTATFFLTSLFVSVLYYFGVIGTILGMALDKLSKRVLSLRLLRTKDFPFFFLGCIVFAVLEPLIIIFHVLAA